MAHIAVSPTVFVTAPNTLHDVIAQAVDRYPLHELCFISSSARDSSIRTKTFSTFNQYVRNLARAMLEWGKPTGSIIVVYLTEHQDNMAAVWACMLAGYLPCLQPVLSAQQAHKEGHIAHIKNLFGSATWLTHKTGAKQIASIPGLEVHLFSELKSLGEKFTVAADWVAYEAKPDDDAMLFLTSGSTGFSKVVVHTHRTILAACRAQGQNYGLTSESRVLNWQRTDLFGCLDLSSIKRINSGGEAIVSKTAQAFVTTNPSAVSFVIAAGFGMTETCAGCVYNYPVDILATEPACEFLDLGRPINTCEIHIVDPADGVTLRPDGESSELQIRGPMVFVRYYNNAEATSSSFVEGGWYRTGYIGIVENGVMRLGGRIKDTIIVFGVSYGIPELKTNLQTIEGVTHSFLAAAPYRAPGQETEGFVIFYSPSFDLDGEDASTKLYATHRALRDICVKMMALPPQFIIPIPVNQMEKTTLGKLSRARLVSLFKQGQFAKHVARSEELLSEARGFSFVAPSTETEKGVAKIYAGIFNLAESEVSVNDNFFELGGTSIDVIKLKREGEAYFDLPEMPTTQILKNPVVSSLANYVDTLLSKGSQTEEYDPIVPLQLTGNKTLIFFVHAGVGEVLVFVNLANYFQNERPFYALRARGFDAGHTFFTTMDEMVSCYAAGIKRTQATGPYAIAGYSYGGVIAFEIAKRLEAMGDEVKFFAPVNIPPNIAKRMQEIDWTAALLHLAGFTWRASLLSRQEQLEFVLKLSPPEHIAELQLTPEKLDKWAHLAKSLSDCGHGYVPTGSVAAINVMQTTAFSGSKVDWINNQLRPWSGYSHRAAWADFSRAEASFTDVPGEHYTLMNLEHVPQFQKIFRSRLEARGL
ncbi:atromentin synthetase [Suillus clintonianus]|uniref:atromentin synthetase n=1 Tax=Suillus clintonianus TaxID=1904413 RepID=UPI001B868E3E|nr:atromentin synthetase [Suillus clintonianus]KAG2122741.1 atromentin synthetase [Suillus clintonianus]